MAEPMIESITPEQALGAILDHGSRVEWHRPWPRVTVSEAGWNRLIEGFGRSDWSLSGLWGDADAVHMAVHDQATGEIAVASLGCDPSGRFPSLARVHPPALRLERAIADLLGLIPEGITDARPWLDHGRWPVRRPLLNPLPRTADPAPYAFLPAQGESLHQIPVGPVHAGIIEPGHFRFTANGETVVRLEQRLGYVHKGIEGLLAGASLEQAARLAGRVSGDSTVAYALAFARAVEAALDAEPPGRAHWLRALLAELERLANHLGDIGAICNDAAFALMHTHCGILREQVLRTSKDCFGHRLLMDCVRPGGIGRDLTAESGAALIRLIAQIRSAFPALVELYDNTASLQDRTVGTGIVPAALVRQFGCGGYIGRASGRAFDSRRTPGYPPYDRLQFRIPVLTEGDVNARVWIRIQEIEQSLALMEQILESLPAGPVFEPLAQARRYRRAEGMALVEGFRGDILAWVRIGAGGRVKRCHLRDPSWFQWPLLEAAIEGNIVADFPLCNKSFNCSYSGHDL